MLAAAETSPPLLTDARICHLHGLIIDEDHDVLQHYHLDSDEKDYPGTRLVGLLLTYIENKGTLEDLAPWSDCTNEDRLRWSQQIRDSVECLRAAGVAWGDAKPENVLVDKEAMPVSLILVVVSPQAGLTRISRKLWKETVRLCKGFMNGSSTGPTTLLLVEAARWGDW